MTAAVDGIDLSDWDRALAAYGEALRLRPDDAQTHQNVGVVRSRRDVEEFLQRRGLRHRCKPHAT